MPRKVSYATDFQPDFGMPWAPLLTRAELETWTKERLERYAEARQYAERQAEINPVGGGWILPSWQEVMKDWKNYSNHCILGGNRCVRGDTEIFDPVACSLRPIAAIQEPFHVLAWDGRKLVAAAASKPFTKGVEEMLEITWRIPGVGKRTIHCTREHQMLSDRGWMGAGDVLPGQKLFAPCARSEWVEVTGCYLSDSYEVWDISVPEHENYICAGVVHHNSTKSTLASRLIVWSACMIPEAEIVAYHVNEDRSIEQQRFVWEAIPNSIKNLPTKKGQNHSITYSQKNGFTDSIVIFPPLQGCRRGGTISFKSYKQYQQDAQTAEGWKAHVIWLDEECPQKLFETLQYRIVDYKGRIILTFTTLNGWTPLVQDILGKTKTLKKRHAPLIGKELPIKQESLTRTSTCINYFWTADNAFIDTSDFLAQIKNRPQEEILARAYGIPTKSIAGVFPAFDKEINVIKRADLPWVKDPSYQVTRFMSIDPAGSKNWFMLWVAVDADNTWFVYREWPDLTYGEWALPGSTAEGKPGPAQKGSGKGIKDYVELIRDLEAGETIYERFIDPRLGAAEKQSMEGATSIISELDDCDMTVIPAPGVEIENGIQLINSKLSWDQTKPRSATNAPHFYITEDCLNTIHALAEYTAKGGLGEACKDCIDGLRYLAVSNIEFIEPSMLKYVDNRPTGVY